MEIGAKWLVVAAGFISTLASFLGGYLMYTEGLAALERTVEEVGRADAQAMYREAKRNFDTVADYQMKYRDVLLRNDFPSRGDLSKWMRTHVLADIMHGDTLQSITMKSVHNTDPQGHLQEIMWIDPLQDGSRDYVYAQHFAHLNESLCRAPCVVCNTLDKVTALQDVNVYNFTDGDFPALYEEASQRMEAEDTWWNRPVLWYSSDQTPYVFIEFFRLMPPIETGFLSNMRLFVGATLSTHPFETFMLEYNTDATLVLTQLHEGADSFILAANTEDGRINPACAQLITNLDSESQPCMRTLRNLTATQRDLILGMRDVEDWAFVRRGGHWAMRSVVFTPGTFDLLEPVYLVWFRSVSQVKDEMNRALYLFIGFLCGVMVFDLMIGIAEIMLVARPLMRLSMATGPLQQMKLEEAEMLANADVGQPVQIREVVAMRRGLIFAVRSLQEYKSFMPATLFATDDEESESEMTSTQSGQSAAHSQSARRSAATAATEANVQQQATAIGLHPARIAAAFIGLPSAAHAGGSGGGAGSKRGAAVRELPGEAIFSLIEDKVKKTHGQLHGFVAVHFDTFLVTWSGYKRDEMAATFCISMAHDMQVALAVATSTGWMAGNTGTKTYRGFAMQGKATENLLRSFAFASYAAGRLGAPGIITPQACAKAMSSVAISIPIGQVVCGEEASMMCEMHALKQEENEEWMYTLDEAKDSHSADALFDALRKGAGTDLDMEKLDVATPLARRLKEVAGRHSKPYDVFTVTYAPQRFIDHGPAMFE